MQAQTIFTRVANHLLRQNKQSMRRLNGGTTCAYRGRGGTSCAVGCLIPDDAYTPKMEGDNVWGVIQRFADRLPKWFPEHRHLLENLQRIHDGWMPDEWPDQLRHLAKMEGLKLPADLRL